MSSKKSSVNISNGNSNIVVTMNPESLFIKPGFNIRLPNALDLESMAETLMADKGIIVDPLHVHEEKDGRFQIIRGHRRFGAALSLLQTDGVPEEIKSNLKKIPVVVHKGLDETGKFNLMLDHGNVKGLGKAETALAVRRLMMENPGISAKQVIDRLLYPLAVFANNLDKLHSVPSDPKEREVYLMKWLKGTASDYIMKAAKMGHYVWGQFILTCKAKDKLLEKIPGSDNQMEKVEVTMSRDRINGLGRAKEADSATTGWNPDTGGVTFNALIEQYKKEEQGNAETGSRTTRPTIAALKETASLFSTPALRAAILKAAGEEAPGLMEMDQSLVAIDNMMKFLATERDQTSGNLRELLDAILSNDLDAIKVAINNLK